MNRNSLQLKQNHIHQICTAKYKIKEQLSISNMNKIKVFFSAFPIVKCWLNFFFHLSLKQSSLAYTHFVNFDIFLLFTDICEQVDMPSRQINTLSLMHVVHFFVIITIYTLIAHRDKSNYF